MSLGSYRFILVVLTVIVASFIPTLQIGLVHAITEGNDSPLSPRGCLALAGFYLVPMTVPLLWRLRRTAVVLLVFATGIVVVGAWDKDFSAPILHLLLLAATFAALRSQNRQKAQASQASD